MNITRLTQWIELLATKDKFIYALVARYYKLLVKREALLAGIGPEDKVLCFGGGICPCTAILLHQYTKAHITVIDNNRACAEESRCFLHRQGLEHIRVACREGAEINCADYTVIHIAMQITPKEAVVNQVVKKARPGTRVLVRIPKENLQSLYSNLNRAKPSFNQQIQHGPFSNIGNTAIYIVEKEPAKDLHLAVAI